jgi:hypothetical protein
MPSGRQNEQLSQDKKRTDDGEQDPTPQEREQPWKKIMPIVEAHNKVHKDARETFECNQGFYNSSLAA